MSFLHLSGLLLLTGAFLLCIDIIALLRRKQEKSVFFHTGYAFVVLGSLHYMLSFVTSDFTLYEVYLRTSKSLSFIEKLSASWAGAGGSLVLWAFILSLLGLFLRSKNYTNTNSAVLLNSFLILLSASALATGSFRVLDAPVINGQGLYPSLKVLWMYMHPPLTFLGYSFALLCAVMLIANRENVLKIFASLSWVFITAAGLVGAYWSYSYTGLGRYWSWDPVETSMLLPWLVLTAYFHSRFSEKLRTSLLYLLCFAVLFATFVGKGGVYSPYHAYATPSLATYIFLVASLLFLVKFFEKVPKARTEWIKTSSLTRISLTLGSLSLLGMFFLLFLLMVYLVFRPAGYVLPAFYYNLAVYPFLILLLLSLIGCSFGNASKRRFLLVASATIVAGFICAIAAATGNLVWSGNTTTDILIFFSLPVLMATVLSALVNMAIRRKNFSLASLHIAFPIIVIGVVLSAPFSYDMELFKPYTLPLNTPVAIGDIKLEYLGISDIETRGSISIPGLMPESAEFPEEVSAKLKFRVWKNNKAEIYDTRGSFNLAMLAKGGMPFHTTPILVKDALREYQLVIDYMTLWPLIFEYAKVIDNQLSAGEASCEHCYNIVLAYLGYMVGYANATEFRAHLQDWSVERSGLAQGITVNVKYVPFVDLIWIGLSILIAAEVAMLAKEVIRCKKSRSGTEHCKAVFPEDSEEKLTQA